MTVKTVVKIRWCFFSAPNWPSGKERGQCLCFNLKDDGRNAATACYSIDGGNLQHVITTL